MTKNVSSEFVLGVRNTRTTIFCYFQVIQYQTIIAASQNGFGLTYIWFGTYSPKIAYTRDNITPPPLRKISAESWMSSEYFSKSQPIWMCFSNINTHFKSVSCEQNLGFRSKKLSMLRVQDINSLNSDGFNIFIKFQKLDGGLKNRLRCNLGSFFTEVGFYYILIWSWNLAIALFNYYSNKYWPPAVF